METDMNIQNSPTDIHGESSRHNRTVSQVVRVVQVVSWLINLVFLAALAWAIYQAVVNRNPLPAWAWLGVLVLFAVAVGLVVMVVVYRGVGELDVSGVSV